MREKIDIKEKVVISIRKIEKCFKIVATYPIG